MNDMQNYYKNALLNGLCSDFKGMWQSAMKDNSKLFDLAMHQQSLPHMCTYAYKGEGLSRGYIEEQFGDYINGKRTAIDVDGVEGNYKTDIYVGYTAHLTPSSDIITFMWCNIPLLQFEATRAKKLYIACESEIHITCDGFNNIIIMLFDKSKVVLDDVDENSSVFVYRYSDEAIVEQGKFCFGKVKVFDKELIL